MSYLLFCMTMMKSKFVFKVGKRIIVSSGGGASRAICEGFFDVLKIFLMFLCIFYAKYLVVSKVVYNFVA